MSDELKSAISGYGLVFKRVFKDGNLDIEAKALYAYLSAYAGNDAVAFPGVELICHELKISERRYKKYRKQLEVNGYIKVERKRKNSGFSNNIYTIYHNPVSLQNVPLQNVPLQNVSLQNVGTTNNSITNNSITNNSNTDCVGQSLALIFNTFINVSQTVIRDIEQSLEKIGDDAYPITEIVIEYTKNQNKDVKYLSGILFNFKKEKITTVEQAKQSLKPRKTKQQKQQEKSNFWEEQFKEVGDN
ncbi:helix-turn-helix domain-containing protein [Staphylococcus pettenkoferi]|uniref:Helix-turn-helix domain-containing protein n=1 Tax=Staphylococcus pettenkoferi TaxID=170573 RepID=A0ABT4BMY6_9STAP|nr:helix-turn-helix domain-containing protein [Staphylococcus pettenkoferi]MCY1583312.1 helix-turn-helix domain-containing protein [Staphylococcus pettenkoferi]